MNTILLTAYPALTLAASALLLWMATKTEENFMQKMFAGLGILYLALTFLQTGSISIDGVTTTCTTNTTLTNITTESCVTSTSSASMLEQGHLSLFIVNIFTFIIVIAWFFVDFLGITIKTMHDTIERLL